MKSKDEVNPWFDDVQGIEQMHQKFVSSVVVQTSGTWTCFLAAFLVSIKFIPNEPHRLSWRIPMLGYIPARMIQRNVWETLGAVGFILVENLPKKRHHVVYFCNWFFLVPKRISIMSSQNLEKFFSRHDRKQWLPSKRHLRMFYVTIGVFTHHFFFSAQICPTRDDLKIRIVLEEFEAYHTSDTISFASIHTKSSWLVVYWWNRVDS